MPLTKITTKRGHTPGSTRMRGERLTATKLSEQATIAASEARVMNQRKLTNRSDA